MSAAARSLVKVALAVPLRGAFDYWDIDAQSPIGARVRVPFGRRSEVGVVVDRPANSNLEASRIRSVLERLDAEPLLSAELLALSNWAANYYHHPIGEVIAGALPQWLRQGRSTALGEPGFTITEAGRLTDPDALRSRAPRQAELLEHLMQSGPVTSAELRRHDLSVSAQAALLQKALIEPIVITAAALPARPTGAGPDLSADQAHAVQSIAAVSGFAAFLLHGVTGSGKTEVYLHLVRETLQNDRQALLLVPEIGLTPQLVARLEQRFGSRLAVLHSGLADKARFSAWERARKGDARLVVGTRSAVFAELPNLGLIVVDEEHDHSFKQQTGFRYHARDVAVRRAQQANCRIILGSATPSLESLNNARAGRYTLLRLPERIGEGGIPAVHIVDLRQHDLQQGLSAPLLERMQAHLARGRQCLLFLNRRGFAPTLFCPSCTCAVSCAECDAHLTVHARAGALRCHHCGREEALTWSCSACGSERVAVGAGTQRVTDSLRQRFPDYRIATLDRDVTARAGALEEVLDGVHQGTVDILVGTQMLTKGHDFPNVTFVGILNADQGLFGTDFRSEERLAQTLLQVTGRAGRRDDRGEVCIQTLFPEHPLLRRLLSGGFDDFADFALLERQLAGWPPFAFLVAIRADSRKPGAALGFLQRLRKQLPPGALPLRILGPAPAQMEKRNGRYRAQLVLQCTSRPPLHGLISQIQLQILADPPGQGIRWAIDVDPAEL